MTLKEALIAILTDPGRKSLYSGSQLVALLRERGIELPTDNREAWEQVEQVRYEVEMQVFRGKEGGATIDLAVYQDGVQRTCAVSETSEQLKLALIGLLGEAGEIAEPLKKHLYSNHALDRAHLLEEVGDLLWYLATLCNALDLSLEDALCNNVEKLRKRYPDGFSSERSIHRVDVPASASVEVER